MVIISDFREVNADPFIIQNITGCIMYYVFAVYNFIHSFRERERIYRDSIYIFALCEYFVEVLFQFYFRSVDKVLTVLKPFLTFKNKSHKDRIRFRCRHE